MPSITAGSEMPMFICTRTAPHPWPRVEVELEDEEHAQILSVRPVSR